MATKLAIFQFVFKYGKIPSDPGYDETDKNPIKYLPELINWFSIVKADWKGPNNPVHIGILSKLEERSDDFPDDIDASDYQEKVLNVDLVLDTIPYINVVVELTEIGCDLLGDADTLGGIIGSIRDIAPDTYQEGDAGVFTVSGPAETTPYYWVNIKSAAWL